MKLTEQQKRQIITYGLNGFQDFEIAEKLNIPLKEVVNYIKEYYYKIKDDFTEEDKIK